MYNKWGLLTLHKLFLLAECLLCGLGPSCSIGTVTKNGVKSEPKGDFAISLEALVEAGINTGFLARAVDGKTK